jgi:hypothetical protein
MLVSNQFTRERCRARCEAEQSVWQGAQIRHGSNIFHPVAKPRASETCIEEYIMESLHNKQEASAKRCGRREPESRMQKGKGTIGCAPTTYEPSLGHNHDNSVDTAEWIDICQHRQRESSHPLSWGLNKKTSPSIWKLGEREESWEDRDFDGRAQHRASKESGSQMCVGQQRYMLNIYGWAYYYSA